MTQETAVDKLNNIKQKYSDMIEAHLKRYEEKKIDEEELLTLAAQSARAIFMEVVTDMRIRGYNPLKVIDGN